MGNRAGTSRDIDANRRLPDLEPVDHHAIRTADRDRGLRHILRDKSYAGAAEQCHRPTDREVLTVYPLGDWMISRGSAASIAA